MDGLSVAVSYQLSAISYQLSAISYQLSAIEATTMALICKGVGGIPPANQHL
jgi:hypothetical protein